MNLKPHHAFIHESDRVVLNIEDMAATCIDEEVYDFLSSIDGPAPRRPLSRIRRELERLGLFNCEERSSLNDSEADLSTVSDSSPIRNLALFVTQNCNLRCSYCYGNEGGYGSSGNMTIETAKRAVDWLIDQSGEVKRLGIAFFGGEPLLNFRLMLRVVAYSNARAREVDKEFEFSVTTNGSLLSDKRIRLLKESNITPLISFDGPKNIHDSQRPFKGGEGSYDTIVPKIANLLETFPNATARATLTGNNSPRDVKIALRNIGFRSTHVAAASASLFEPGGQRQDSQIGSKTMLTDLYDEAADLYDAIKCRDLDLLGYLKRNGSLVSRLSALMNKEKKRFGCGAGRAYVGVDNVGNVYLCHRFVGTERYKLGNIHAEDIDRDKYLVSPLAKVDKCATCFARHLCGGGCYHENLGASGGIDTPSNNYCHVMKSSVELASLISSKLDELDKMFLVREEIVSSRPCPFDFPD